MKNKMFCLKIDLCITYLCKILIKAIQIETDIKEIYSLYSQEFVKK